MTLVVHCGGRRITREELAQCPEPVSQGPRHKPIPHIKVLESVEAALTRRQVSIKTEDLAVQSKDDTKFFAFLTLDPDSPGLHCSDDKWGYGIGLRNAHDRTSTLKGAGGGHIFVCDNWAFTPGLVQMNRKHTHGLDMEEEVEMFIFRLLKKLSVFPMLVAQAKDALYSDNEARELILDAFIQREILPIKFLPSVYKDFFDGTPETSDCIRSCWAMHNAFTRSCRELKPARKFKATLELGNLLAGKWN